MTIGEKFHSDAEDGAASQNIVQEPIELVARLARMLDDSGIAYCHWKSNAEIARSESGENDLDLLVARSDTSHFREVLAKLGFVTATSDRKPAPPGKEDYMGYDAGSGRIVHVDVHYQLVLGHDRTKNYRVPVEAAFLASAQRSGTLRLPPPELEYVVLLIRMVLKYAILDEVLWQAALRRRVSPKSSELAELDHLEAAIEPQLLQAVLAEHFSWLTPEELDSFAALARGHVTLRKRLRIGRQLQRNLTSYAQHGEIVDGTLRITRRVRLVLQRRLGRQPRFHASGGGLIVAIVGGDGSGKSTAVAELVRWLGTEFDVRHIHLGKPRWSATTFVVRATLKAARTTSGRAIPLSRRPGRGRLVSEPSLRKMAWLVCTARDRYLTYRRARRFANRGGIVVSDRYPHEALVSMEVPQISRLAGENPSRLANVLSRLEHGYYDRIGPPEKLIVLHIDPDVAAARKLDEPPDYVRRRVSEVAGIDWTEPVQVIDAEQSESKVAAQLKTVIWKELS